MCSLWSCWGLMALFWKLSPPRYALLSQSTGRLNIQCHRTYSPIWVHAHHNRSQSVPVCKLARSALLGAQVGFRRSEVKGRQLLVNNQAILCKGACR